MGVYGVEAQEDEIGNSLMTGRFRQTLKKGIDVVKRGIIIIGLMVFPGCALSNLVHLGK